MPTVWPISWIAVDAAPGLVRSQPKFMVRVLAPMFSTSRPTADHDPDLGLGTVGDFAELEPDADVFPRPERAADHVLLLLRSDPGDEPGGAVGELDGGAVGLAVEEVVVQDGAVDPLAAALEQGAQPVGAEAGGNLWHRLWW